MKPAQYLNHPNQPCMIAVSICIPSGNFYITCWIDFWFNLGHHMAKQTMFFLCTFDPQCNFSTSLIAPSCFFIIIFCFHASSSIWMLFHLYIILYNCIYSWYCLSILVQILSPKIYCYRFILPNYTHGSYLPSAHVFY